MLHAKYADAVVFWAPAKVNLFLEVLAKRLDGYHEIATLMVAVGLFDRLEFREESVGKVVLQCDLPELSTGPENLVTRAADLLKRRTDCQRGAEIRLSKRIPLAAGLAGGSSDAAATLAGLNELWALGLTRTELMALSAELGSDVAFFFATPAAWCTGRGERVQPLTLGRPLIFVLVCPRQGLATTDVYSGVKVPERPLSGEEIRQAVEQGDIEAIGRRLHNRLQSAAEQLCPEVAAHRTRLQELRPAGCLMSGSGSSLFALCRDEPEAKRIVQGCSGIQIEAAPRVFLVPSCS